MSNGMKEVSKRTVTNIEPRKPNNLITTEVSDDGIQDPPSMSDIMKPITWSMIVCGIHFMRKKTEWQDPADAAVYTRNGTCAPLSSTIIYNIITVLVFFWGLFRLLASMIIGDVSTESLFLEILSSAWGLLGTINGVICLKSSTSRYGHLQVFFSHWEEKVTSDFRALKIQYNSKKLRRAFLITFTISWMVIAFNIVGTGILVFAPLGAVSDAFSLLFTSPFPTIIPIKCVTMIVHCYYSCAWILPAPLVVISSLAIKYGFLALCDAMEREIRLSDDKLTDKLRDFRKAHLNLCRCIEILDKDINILNANWYVINVPLACFILYILIHFGKGIFSMAVFTFWLVTSLGYVAVTSFFVARLHETAHSLQKPLLEIETNDISLEKLTQLNLFLVKLNGPSIGFTALTLITITKEFLLTLVGVFLTYFFLILQFNAQ
ncbi:hypothetical protein ACJMK2_044383 [Sinanodonta woodiana]|uniref:Odorant receptor n=1 Tax=Sinanodonta woodiana TaxID=1069815 RepID=A0ABD3W197_SINWO